MGLFLLPMMGKGFLILAASVPLLQCMYPQLRSDCPLATLARRSGLAVLFATFAVAALGTLGFRYLGLIHVLPDHMHASLKAWHRKAGAFTFFGSVFVVMLGLSTQGIHKVRSFCALELT